eukprot:16290756-Heterocapsa_arctica.AAC.1
MNPDGLETEVDRYRARTHARDLRTRFPSVNAGCPEETGFAGTTPDPQTDAPPSEPGRRSPATSRWESDQGNP